MNSNPGLFWWKIFLRNVNCFGQNNQPSFLAGIRFASKISVIRPLSFQLKARHFISEVRTEMPGWSSFSKQTCQYPRNVGQLCAPAGTRVASTTQALKRNEDISFLTGKRETCARANDPAQTAGWAPLSREGGLGSWCRARVRCVCKSRACCWPECRGVWGGAVRVQRCSRRAAPRVCPCEPGEHARVAGHLQGAVRAHSCQHTGHRHGHGECAEPSRASRREGSCASTGCVLWKGKHEKRVPTKRTGVRGDTAPQEGCVWVGVGVCEGGMRRRGFMSRRRCLGVCACVGNSVPSHPPSPRAGGCPGRGRWRTAAVAGGPGGAGGRWPGPWLGPPVADWQRSLPRLWRGRAGAGRGEGGGGGGGAVWTALHCRGSYLFIQSPKMAGERRWRSRRRRWGGAAAVPPPPPRPGGAPGAAAAAPGPWHHVGRPGRELGAGGGQVSGAAAGRGRAAGPFPAPARPGTGARHIFPAERGSPPLGPCGAAFSAQQ